MSKMIFHKYDLREIDSHIKIGIICKLPFILLNILT